MIEPIRITDPARIDDLVALLHDQNLDLDRLRNEPNQAVLEVPLLLDDDDGKELLCDSWCRRYFKLPLRRGVLLIRHVATYRVDDRGQIGRYTINTVFWSQQDSTLTIKACEDMEIHAQVKSLDVELIPLADIAGHRDVTLLFGFVEYTGPVILRGE